jgi:ATP-binding cassette subfamily B protein
MSSAGSVRIGEVAEILGKNPAFQTVHSDRWTRVDGRFSVLTFRLGETVLASGVAETALYVVFAGRARIVDERPGSEAATLTILSAGDTFGEEATLGRSNSCLVRAAGDVTVLKLSEPETNALLASHPQCREALEQRAEQLRELSLLRRLAVFTNISVKDLHRLRAELRPVELQPGQELFHESDMGESGYVVRQGRLRILKEFGGKSRQIGLTNPGDLLGELSLLCGTPRTVTAVAATSAVVLELPKEIFDSVMTDPQQLEAIMEDANDRLMQYLAYKHDPEGEDAAQQRIVVTWRKARSGWLERTYPNAATSAPSLNGLACLAMVEAFHRKSGVPQADVDRKMAEGRPETLESLSRTGEELGYLTRLTLLEASQLPEAPLPAILETNPGVFAVLFEVSPKGVVVSHPDGRLVSMSREDFEAAWDRRLLFLANLPSAAATPGRVGAIIQQYLPFLRPHARIFLGIAAVSLLAQAGSLVLPIFNGTLIDKVLVTFDVRLLNLMLFGIISVTAFQMAAGAIRQYLSAHVMRRVSSAVQLRFFNHILRFPMRALAGWQVGDFTVRLSENDQVLHLATESVFSVLLSGAMVLMNVFLLFAISGPMAPVALGFIVAYGFLMWMSSPRLRAADNMVFHARKSAESYFIEAVGGIQTIKSLAVESAAYKQGLDLVESLKTSETRAARLAFYVSSISGLLTSAATVVVLGWGAMLTLNGKMTTGQLVTFNVLLGATLGPLSMLAGTWDQLQQLRISFARTSDVMNVEPERNAKNAGLPSLRGEVTLEDVSFRYADDAPPVLRGINLSVRPGEKVALVGRSGSGKTTLAGLLLSIFEPTSGRVLMDQIDIANLNKGALRRQIGFVEQQPYVFSGTIRENIAKADPGAGLESVVAAATLAGAHSFIRELPLGYDTPIGERGTKLSGGQKQRIVIARALLNQPRMLVLDEATSSLDTESEQAIQHNLDSMMAGKTTFVIAHRLSTVRNADRIVVMEEGKIVEQGTHDDLMARKGLYHHLATAAD